MTHLSKRLHPELFRLKYFERVFLRHRDLLPTADDFDEMFVPENTSLLLGHYSKAMIYERLEHYKVLPKLRKKGFTKIKLKLETSDIDRQQVFVYDKLAEPDRILAEISLHLGTFLSQSKYARELKDRNFKMLYIQWLCLQNPRAKFSPQRPALPGQVYPGLKIGREVMRMLVMLASKLDLDGVINIPEFPHAAVLYSQRFRFLNPNSEGILQAFRRDMQCFSLAKASWGIMTGCVRDIATNKPQQWFQEEQVLPISDLWVEHFKSKKYREQRQEAFMKHKFVFDQKKWEGLKPINVDGTPKVVADRGLRF